MYTQHYDRNGINYIVIDICQIVCMRMESQDWVTSLLRSSVPSSWDKHTVCSFSDRADTLVQECFIRTGGEVCKTLSLRIPDLYIMVWPSDPPEPPFHVTFCRVKINLFHWRSFLYYYWSYTPVQLALKSFRLWISQANSLPFIQGWQFSQMKKFLTV